MGTEGGKGDLNFLKAGPRQILQPKSISPLEVNGTPAKLSKILPGSGGPGDEIVVDSDADDGG